MSNKVLKVIIKKYHFKNAGELGQFLRQIKIVIK